MARQRIDSRARRHRNRLRRRHEVGTGIVDVLACGRASTRKRGDTKPSYHSPHTFAQWRDKFDRLRLLRVRGDTFQRVMMKD